MGIRRRCLGVTVLVCLGGVCAAARGEQEPARSEPLRPVDTRRLVGARHDAADWLTFGHDYTNQRYSGSRAINAANVKGLDLRWKFQTGLAATFQTTPLVADGVMYITTPFNHVVALDAANGQPLWRYEHVRKSSPLCCGPANRGAALGYGKVYMATVDARLIALDRRTGTVVWDIDLAGPETAVAETAEALSEDDPLRHATVSGTSGVGANMAPLVYDGKVVVGITGVGYGLHLDGQAGQAIGAVVGMAGRYGRRGFLAAFDAESGREIWRWYTVPESGWEGVWRTTTPDGEPLHRDIAVEQAELSNYPDAWRTGGGSTWTTPALDPKLGLLFLGVGNPSPQLHAASRPGDNLYTVSLVALDVDTGELRWHYQQVPHDVWGYDVGSPPVLFDAKIEGRVVPAVGQAGKTGWFYVHDRRTGRLLLRSEAFVPQENMFRPPAREGVVIAPGAAGGASWSPVAYHPVRRLAYVAALHMPMRYTVHVERSAGAATGVRYTKATPAGGNRWGTLSAIDVDTGKIVWQNRTEQPLVGGVLATPGDLVFMGEGNGRLNAFHAGTGQALWQFQAEAGVNAPPITYEVDGTQYVAVAAGGSHLFGYPQGDWLLVFALPEASAESVAEE